MRRPRAGPFKETNNAALAGLGRSTRKYWSRSCTDSGARGRMRPLLPLPWMRIWASGSSTSSRLRSSTSRERNPWSNIRPTIARSREQRKLGPEARHFLHRQRNDGAFGGFHAHAAEGGNGAAQAHGGAAPVGDLKTGRNLAGRRGE